MEKIDKTGGAGKMAEPVDLANLDTVKASNDGARCELKHPGTNAPLGIALLMYGPDSDVAKESYRKIADKRIERLRKGIKEKPGNEAKEAAEYVASFVYGWEPEPWIEDDKPLTFSVEEVARLFLKYPWMKEQADDFGGKRGNFLAS